MSYSVYNSLQDYFFFTYNSNPKLIDILTTQSNAVNTLYDSISTDINNANFNSTNQDNINSLYDYHINVTISKLRQLGNPCFEFEKYIDYHAIQIWQDLITNLNTYIYSNCQTITMNSIHLIGNSIYDINTNIFSNANRIHNADIDKSLQLYAEALHNILKNNTTELAIQVSKLKVKVEYTFRILSHSYYNKNKNRVLDLIDSILIGIDPQNPVNAFNNTFFPDRSIIGLDTTRKLFYRNSMYLWDINTSIPDIDTLI